MKKAWPLGQAMNQARARFKRAVEAGEKALEHVGKAQKIFAAAQEDVILAQTDLETCKSQVNASFFKTLDALTGAVERLWNPDARLPLEHLVRLIQESNALVQASSVLSTQAGAAAVNAAEVGEADFPDTEADEQRLADFEDTHALEGPRHASSAEAFWGERMGACLGHPSS